MHSRKAARGKSSWGEKCISEARTLRRLTAAPCDSEALAAATAARAWRDRTGPGSVPLSELGQALSVSEQVSSSSLAVQVVVELTSATQAS